MKGYACTCGYKLGEEPYTTGFSCQLGAIKWSNDLSDAKEMISNNTYVKSLPKRCTVRTYYAKNNKGPSPSGIEAAIKEDE